MRRFTERWRERDERKVTRGRREGDSICDVIKRLKTISGALKLVERVKGKRGENQRKDRKVERGRQRESNSVTLRNLEKF